MCFVKTHKKIGQFNFGYRVMRKTEGLYYSAFSLGTMSGDFRGTPEALPKEEWLDEMAWRNERLLLKRSPEANVGWHVFSTIEQAKEFTDYFPYLRSFPTAIVRVECYGLDEPYGLGLAFDQPVGRFQFMKILEEVT